MCIQLRPMTREIVIVDKAIFSKIVPDVRHARLPAAMSYLRTRDRG